MGHLLVVRTLRGGQKADGLLGERESLPRGFLRAFVLGTVINNREGGYKRERGGASLALPLQRCMSGKSSSNSEGGHNVFDVVSDASACSLMVAKGWAGAVTKNVHLF